MRSLTWMMTPLRSRPDLGLALWLAGCSTLWACEPKEPEAAPDAIAEAEQMYTACVEDELGIEVLALDIRASGDIDVEFGEGYTEEGEASAISICEPRAL